MASTEVTEHLPPPQSASIKDRVCKVFTWSKITAAIIQLVGFIAAVVFGVWVIKSYEVAQRAIGLSEMSLRQAEIGLRQTLIANQLAFLALCRSNEWIDNSSTCYGGMQGGHLSSIAVQLGLVPTSVTSLPPTKTQSTPPTITVTATLISTSSSWLPSYSSSFPTTDPSPKPPIDPSTTHPLPPPTTAPSHPPPTTAPSHPLPTITPSPPPPPASPPSTQTEFPTTEPPTTSAPTDQPSNPAPTLSTTPTTKSFPTTPSTPTPTISLVTSGTTLQSSAAEGSGGGSPRKPLSFQVTVGIIVGILTALAAIIAMYVGCRRRKAWNRPEI